MTMHKKAKNTLTPIELDTNETFKFTLLNNRDISITLLKTGTEIIKTNLKILGQPEAGAKTIYSFFCIISINNKEYKLEREIPTQKSFYEPWNIDGITIWFDAISDIFESDGGFLLEKDKKIGIVCKPNKKARFAIQDSKIDICPEKLHAWCPLPKEGIKINNCYTGQDCWMGTYQGALAHGGLDINHPIGTPLWAPLDIDDHYYFNSLEMGHNNNRWRGIHKWENGSIWILQAHHMTKLLIPEHKPIKKGKQFAKGAGVLSGAVDHSHFVFKIVEGKETYFLDPWILFWKMYNDMNIK